MLHNEIRKIYIKFVIITLFLMKLHKILIEITKKQS